MADKLLSSVTRHAYLPNCYVRPEGDRPRPDEVVGDHNVPVIDLEFPSKSLVVQSTAEACRRYGFFQVINHGVEMELVRRMQGVGREFFRLPSEEKRKFYSDDPTMKMRLSTSFNVRKETVRNWRDYLRLHCYPLDDFVSYWPSNPPAFRDIVSSYSKEIRRLGFRLHGLISESLGLEREYIANVSGEQEQHMAINYYPPCPAPQMTYGLPAHTDPNALTILLQDQHVSGLQVLKDGKWIKVDPHPDAFVVNIGDQLQALSNGRYKSVWHRAVVNSDHERLSVASFLAPSNSAVIIPSDKLIGPEFPAIYRRYTYAEYYKTFWSRNLDQEHCLELFRN